MSLKMAAALLLLSAPVPLSAKSGSDYWITVKTKLALLTDSKVRGTEVNVDTVRGRVTLSGRMDSKAAEQRAIQDAKAIDGVLDVRSLIQIVPASDRHAVRASDKTILSNVRGALAKDPSLADSSIKAQSVSKGVVLLNGQSSSLSDTLRALQVARNQQGVVGVASEIRSPDRLSDAELWKEGATADSSAVEGTRASGAASLVGDLWITTDVKLRLLADPDAPGNDINVDTTNGVVTLFGIVPSDSSKAAAETDARKVGSVEKVRNELQVVPDSERKTVDRRDAQVKQDVETALHDDHALTDANIDVEVKDGVVRLTGSVADPGDRLEAAMTTRQVDGVRAVEQELTTARRVVGSGE